MFDSFISADMVPRLGAKGIEKAVLAGLTSHTCVESAGRHAHDEGFHVTFLADAVAEFTQAAHDAATQISYPTFGHEVLTVRAFLEAVEPARASDPPGVPAGSRRHAQRKA
jgi:ureidoacrylate peracid hydrolase